MYIFIKNYKKYLLFRCNTFDPNGTSILDLRATIYDSETTGPVQLKTDSIFIKHTDALSPSNVATISTCQDPFAIYFIDLF